MSVTKLYELAKIYDEAGIDQVFSENDLLCVELPSGAHAYVSIVEGAIAAYLDEKGLRGYLNLCFQDPEAPVLERAELENAQECYLLILGNKLEDLEEEDKKAVVESSVVFEEGALPQFRIKREFRMPWYLDEAGQEDMIHLLQALLFAKDYFSAFGKKSRTNSLNPWLESLKIEDSEEVEYMPLLRFVDGTFQVFPKPMEDDLYAVEFPQARLTNEEKVLDFKRMKAKPGKVMYCATGVFPEPLLSPKSPVPLFPVYSLFYDPQNHQVLDILMVEDYDAEHTKMVSRLLEVISQVGKPQALHCFGSRTHTLLSQVCSQIGIKTVKGTANEEMEKLLMEMVEELSHSHEHEHVHGPECHHEHHEHVHGPDCDHHHD